MQVRFRYVLVMLLVLSGVRLAWAGCSIQRQVSDLAADPTMCTPRQLSAVQKRLSARLQFREELDLPLAMKVLEDRTCPSAAELSAFLAAWKQLPKTGFTYTAKRYCLTDPTFYGIRFAAPDKPLDDQAAARLAADIDSLERRLIPALAAKRAEVNGMLRRATPATAMTGA